MALVFLPREHEPVPDGLSRLPEAGFVSYESRVDIGFIYQDAILGVGISRGAKIHVLSLEGALRMRRKSRKVLRIQASSHV